MDGILPIELSGFQSLQPPEFSEGSVMSGEQLQAPPKFERGREALPAASRESSTARSVDVRIHKKRDSVINKLGKIDAPANPNNTRILNAET